MTTNDLLSPEPERRPILGGIFEVSADGRVFRKVAPFSRTKPREMKASSTYLGGYRRVVLRMKAGERKTKTFLIHRLVLLAFRGPCPEGKEAAHLNGNPSDNRLENLAYVTPSENHEHKRIHGTLLMGEKQAAAKLTDAAVRDMRSRYGRGLATQSSLAREYGVCLTVACNAIQGRTWRHVK